MLKRPKAWNPERVPSDIARLCSRLAVLNTGCWVWQGHCDPKGYGQIRIGRRMHWTHRFAYVTFRGEIPAGITVHHTCANASCCNPAHLELATRSENTAEGNARRRSMTCA